MACLTNYTIQCRDVTSGETGCFLFDTEHWQRAGEFKAISPVFPGLVEFYAWDKANGNRRTSCYLERIEEEQNEDACRECGEPNDNGEGYDGLCGNCADRQFGDKVNTE